MTKNIFSLHGGNPRPTFTPSLYPSPILAEMVGLNIPKPEDIGGLSVSLPATWHFPRRYQEHGNMNHRSHILTLLASLLGSSTSAKFSWISEWILHIPD